MSSRGFGKCQKWCRQGEMVDPSNVASVTPTSTNTEWHIDVSHKNGKTIEIACASERDLQETLERGGRLIEEESAPRQ